MYKYFFLMFTAACFVVSNAQVANEANIPITLDTDMDSSPNVVDTDDDGDGVLDNLDAFPLDATKTTAAISTIKITQTHDAGCRNNGANGGRNFGIETSSVLDNGAVRYQIVKFNKPVLANVLTATLIINSNTENDPLNIYYQADNNWVEGTGNGAASNGIPPNGITFTSNNTNFTGKVLLGTTTAPTGTSGNYRYTFSLPLNSLPSSGDFSLIFLDNTNDATQESIFTKETTGKADTVIFTYLTPITARLDVIQLSNDTTYLAGGTYTVGFKLSSAPTATVYVPIAISDTSKAKIVGDKVLEFTTSNWNTQQVKTISATLPGKFDINIRPLHSTDTFMNGHNPEDLKNYYNQATNITNLGPWNGTTNNTFSTTLNAVSAVGSTSQKYKLLKAPVGMGVVENSGKLTFKPLGSQVGTFPVHIQVTDDKGNISYFMSSITITSSGLPDPTGVWVLPNGPAGGTGTATNPYNSIGTAVAASSGGGNVYIRGGEYDVSGQILISASGTASNPIIIQPAPGETVKLNFGTMSLFNLDTNSKYVQIRNLEIDGGTDNVDFWCLVSNAFWGDATIPRGGGLAIIVDGEFITIQGNYIHNCYQKAVEIGRARYLKVYDNIIHSIATTSLSGGHGIMRQQKGGEIFTDDSAHLFRWDLNSNLIFNVEQRIYSWVPSKGFIDMVLDEGKPILIDDPKDTDGNQELMKAKIENNVVAYGSIDQIRLKSTPNLTVKNNTVYSASPTADGITDKIGDTPTPQFTGTSILNNAVQTMPGTIAFEMGDIVGQGNTSPNTPASISGNYAAIGSKVPGSTSGITTTSADLFVNPNNGDFRVKPALGLPSSLGVSPAILDSIDTRVVKFAVNVKWDRWDNDHLKLTQTILDNIPGVNDGISANETVFPDAGTLHLNTLPTRSEIEYNVIPGTAWKTATGAPAKEKFELHPDYAAWYKARNAATKNILGADYTRIRWGNSFTKQDQVFQNTWLTNSQITATDSNTVIYSEANDFTLDGDLLVDFEGHTPLAGEKWNLMRAKIIVSANIGKLFDSVRFEGATLTPNQYSLSIINVPGGQAVELKILNPSSPEINVKGNSQSILDGDNTPNTADSTDFGSTNSTLTRLFRIVNTGSDTLKITSITSTGADAANFTVTSIPSFVKSGDSALFSVLFSSAVLGIKNATITINNNDANEGVYDFAIRAQKLGCSVQTNSINDTMFNTANDSNAFNCANWHSGTYPDSMVNIVIKTGAELKLKKGQELKVHDVFVENGGLLQLSGGILKVYGNINAAAATNAIACDSGKVVFSGTDSNIISNTIPTFCNVEINKPNGIVYFDGFGFQVKNHIDFVKGIIKQGSGGSLEILSGATSNQGNSQSFAACEVRKHNLSSSFVFPTGKADKWARLEVSGSPGGSWRCEYFNTGYPDTSTITPLRHISAKEYWDLEPDGPYTANVKLYWEDATWSGIDLGQTSTNLVVAHFDGTDWENIGNNAINFTPQGSVTATGYTFSPFTFGSLSPLIPLNIKKIKRDSNHITDNKTAIFPNPASKELHITNPELEITCIELFDISGKKIYTFNVEFMHCIINTSELQSGTYILRVLTANNIENRKICIDN